MARAPTRQGQSKRKAGARKAPAKPASALKPDATPAPAGPGVTQDGFTVETRREHYRGQRVSFIRARTKG